MQIPLEFLCLGIRGTIHSTKISRNFGLTLNGLTLSNWESFKKVGPPFKVDHFSWLDRSDRNGLSHLTIPAHSQSHYLAVRHFLCTTWRKTLIIAAFMDCQQRIYRCHSHPCAVTTDNVAASQSKCMFWLLTALKDDLFPEIFRHLKEVFELIRQISGNGLLKITCYTG